MKHISQFYQSYEFNFSRVTVLLGANGVGKSSLLKELIVPHKTVYVEGGRTIRLQDEYSTTGSYDNSYSSLEKTLNEKRNARLSDRIYDAIIALVHKENTLKIEHSEAVTNWRRAGQKDQIPTLDQAPLEQLFNQFSEIFPHISIQYDQRSNRPTVTNNNTEKTYALSLLSDGEKQIFALLADLLQLDEIHETIVVDEPELNLHPELAESVWDLLEQEYPKKTFIYATHSIQFALRSAVTTRYILSSDPNKIREIGNVSELDTVDLKKFLGSVPGILNADTVIVTEGDKKSFDALFYRWLLSDSKIEMGLS